MTPDSDDATGHWCARFDLAANAPAVLLQIRIRAGNRVSHATEALRPGQDFDGVSFEAMAARGSGWLIVRGGQTVIQEVADDDR